MALLAALVGMLSGVILTLTMPARVTTPGQGPVLETVTPAQLGAMNLKLDPALQPLAAPDWLSAYGVRLPASVLLGPEAEAAVRSNTSGVRVIAERVLTYATLASKTGGRTRGPTIAHRLVWAIVGTRAAAGSVTGALPMLWLVDARTGRELVELTVLGPAANAAAAAAGTAAGP
jgi:hypothetical protein